MKRFVFNVLLLYILYLKQCLRQNVIDYNKKKKEKEEKSIPCDKTKKTIESFIVTRKKYIFKNEMLFFFLPSDFPVRFSSSA